MHSFLYDIYALCNIHNCKNPYFGKNVKLKVPQKKEETNYSHYLFLYTPFTIYISHYALHSMHFTVCTSQYAFHSMKFTE